MANSKNQVTTIPLSSKLNMNRNRNQVCTTYDQMNDQNSPLYGGCISPLHAKIQTADANKGLIDKYGKKWYFERTNLYRSDENGENAERYHNFSGTYTFTDTIFDVSADAGVITSNGYIYFAKIVSSYEIEISRYNTNKDLLNTITLPFQSTLKNVRLVERGNNLYLITVSESSANTTTPVSVRVTRLNKSNLTRQVQYQYDTQLGMVQYNGRYNWYASNGMTSTTRKDRTIYTYPIIVSANLVGSRWFGITVLNRHMSGENVLDDFGYCNFLYDTISNIIRPVYVSTAPLQQNSWCTNNGNYFGYLVGGKSITENNDGTYSLSASGSSYSNMSSNSDQGWRSSIPAGIFQENSLWFVQVNYGNIVNTHGYIKSSDNDYFNVYPMSFRADDPRWCTTMSETNLRPSINDGGKGVSLANNESIPSDWGFLAPAWLGGRGPSDGNYCAAMAVDGDEGDRSFDGTMRTIDVTTLTTNQYHFRVIHSGRTPPWGYGSKVIVGGSVMLDSMLYYQSRSMPGILSTTVIPTQSDDWDLIAKNRMVDKVSMYNTAGSCTQVGYWRLLFNYKEGFLSGISYNGGINGEEGEGTLVTAWDEVDDGFVVGVYDRQLLYKDVQGRIHLVNAVASDASNLLENTVIIDNRYLLVKCTSGQNVFDLVTEKWSKFASDWNNRVLQGFNYLFHNDSIANSRWIQNRLNNGILNQYYNTSATTASGFNVAYQATKSFSPSRLLPFVTANYQVTMQPYFVGIQRTSGTVVKGGIDKQMLDYFQSPGTSAPKWKGAVGVNGMSGDSSSLQGTSYPITTSGSLYNNLPIVGVNFINSYNGKFAVQIDNKGYSIQYDGVRPVMLYNSTSVVDNIKEFFIVQSQTYAVVDSYICAISYSSSNTINGIEQLVDVNGMQFIGAFPSVAYFYSPASRSIYAFTGDADLQLFVQTDRISKVYNHLYAPNNEWIFLATNDGIYVLTQQNVFRMPYSKLIPDCTDYTTIQLFMTDDAWNVIGYQYSDGWKYLKLRLDNEDGWETVDVILETEFFGIGDMKQEVCDTWYIRLFKGDESDNGVVKYYATTLTDTVAKTDEKETTITPDMWDDNDNVFIRYQPQYQMTQGSSLHIESPYPIAYLGVSHQGDNTSISHINI